MTADSPASGLPQEAVDAALLAHFHGVGYDHHMRAADGGCVFCYEAAEVAHDLLAAERAKVAALQQAVDKVRELCTDPRQFPPVDITGRPFPHLVRANDLLALLPDVQADDRGTDFLDPSQSAKGEQ